MQLAWVMGGAALWAVSAAGVALVLGAMISRSHRPVMSTPELGALVPAQRVASPSGLRSQPHLPCAGAVRPSGPR
ncbi:MAG: hypothetical protein L0H64_21215 [Pseudonocardia sp.]|nr:hypothetical protein [Pseudonocardia sp.]